MTRIIIEKVRDREIEAYLTRKDKAECMCHVRGSEKLVLQTVKNWIEAFGLTPEVVEDKRN